MRRESPVGIAELMSSPTFTDLLAPGTIISKQWGKRNILIEFDAIRRDILSNGAKTAQYFNSDDDLSDSSNTYSSGA